MSKIPVFVYGTLRPGDYNHDRFPGGVVQIINDCSASGRLYHAFKDHRGYPGAHFDEEGTIVGDILVYDDESRAFQSVVSMELGAGYEVRQIKVNTPNGVIEAIGFHYLQPHGDLIESGDWFADDAYPAHGSGFDRWSEDEYGEDFDDEDDEALWDEED